MCGKCGKLKAKEIIKEDACMKFYDETKSLYVETDASRVGFGAAPLQPRINTSSHGDKAPENSILRPIAFFNKSLMGTKKRYSNLRKKHWVYHMALKNSIIIASQER